MTVPPEYCVDFNKTNVGPGNVQNPDKCPWEVNMLATILLYLSVNELTPAFGVILVFKAPTKRGEGGMA